MTSPSNSSQAEQLDRNARVSPPGGGVAHRVFPQHTSIIIRWYNYGLRQQDLVIGEELVRYANNWGCPQGALREKEWVVLLI